MFWGKSSRIFYFINIIYKLINVNMYLCEGGNAIKIAEPIRGDIAKLIADSIVNKIQQKLKVNACPLGSTGKKSANQMSGDIDIAVELQWNDNNIQKVSEFIKTTYGSRVEIVASPGLRLISMGFPYKLYGKQNIVQVDLMFTTNIEYSNFMYHSPDYIKNESLFKGLYRTNLLIIIAGKTPIDIQKYPIELFGADEFGTEYEGEVKSFWKYTLSYDDGLKIVHKTFEGKRKPLKAPKSIKEDTILLTSDLPAILKICLGEKATIANCNSFETLKEATMNAFENANNGDVVLLSPACASWDQYAKYEDRGDEFKKLVKGLGE